MASPFIEVFSSELDGKDKAKIEGAVIQALDGVLDAGEEIIPATIRLRKDRATDAIVAHLVTSTEARTYALGLDGQVSRTGGLEPGVLREDRQGDSWHPVKM